MWTLSKQSRERAISHAQLQSVILERTAELQNLSQRLLRVQDEERRKLARDLHDSTGQTLAALKISVSFLEENHKQDPSTMALVSEVAALADQAIGEIRTMSYLLHPPLLDEAGFACAAEWYVEGFAKRSGVHVTLDITTVPERLPKEIEIAFFRVLQESLTNVHRHSGASEVSVCFQRQSENIVLEIRDCGRGMPAERLARLRAARAETGVGLAGMRERLHELNGKLEIESNGHGTTMRAIVPLFAVTRSGRLGDCGPVTASSRDAICQPREATTPKYWESPIPRQPSVPATPFMQPAKSVLRHKRPWNVHLAAVVTILGLACWIAYSGPHSASFVGSSELQRSTAIEEQVPLPPAMAVPGEDGSKLQTVPVPVREARAATLLQRMELAQSEVVHIGEDVTVRYFTPKPAPHRAVVQYQVVHIGEDVTVRYFTPIGRHTRN
jgi:anti-sigma regulatory factor (Ser/Thr protein kinase)